MGHFHMGPSVKFTSSIGSLANEIGSWFISLFDLIKVRIMHLVNSQDYPVGTNHRAIMPLQAETNFFRYVKLNL